MRYRVLGPLEVEGDDDRPIPLGGPKQRVVLAHLLLRTGQTVPADVLIDAVWGEEPPAAARNTLQSYVSRLRSLLGAELIDGRSPGYRFLAAPEEVDVVRFEELVQQAQGTMAANPRRSADLLAEAMGLWRGPALADLAQEPSLTGEIARLEELRVSATEDRVAADLAIGRHAAAVAQLEALVDAHPLRERLWGQLVLALYRSGRQAEALNTYQRARATLAEELGIDPSRDLQQLHERILHQDPDLDLQGEPLRGYRLLERVGEGAFGVVHRALQPGVGREVAVKVIHRRIAHDPEFVRRFEADAQTVARLEHPRVVPLYDDWRDPDGAYLVTRFMRGGSLRAELARGDLNEERALRIADQIAEALDAAHRQGVVHGDLRPENVLLDEDGNAYLGDFVIAGDLRGGPSGDLEAFEVLVRELVGSGASPGREPLDDPGPGFPDAIAIAAATRNALGTVPLPVPDPTAARNPFKGLRSFQEADAQDFFGRESLVARLTERMGERAEGARFLAVVGPSGSGKSSAVRAGLLPALRAGALPGSDTWFYVDMAPGAHPVEELDAALLRVAVNAPPSLIEELQRDDEGILRAVEHVLPDDGSELVLVIDQFEELFTLSEDEGRRRRILRGLEAAVLDPRSRLRLIVTFRADFYDRPLAYGGFAELVRNRTETVIPLTPEELERAVVGPAVGAGVMPEAGLVADIVADVADQPAALPLMQYALTELFDRRRDGLMTVEDYRAIGGVTGALARRAEQLHGLNDTKGRDATRQVFLRLVSLGEGSEDTRRRVPRSELDRLGLDPAALDAVIDAYGRHRLLSFDRDPETRGPTVEVAHEALLRSWDRLASWIDAAREDLRTERRLAAAAAEWEDAQRDASFLLSGARLTQLGAWAETTDLALAPGDRAFLIASERQRDEDLVAEEGRRAKEVQLERRSVHRLRALVAVLTASALIAAGLTVVAFEQRGEAQQQTRVASARELAAAAEANLSVDPERSSLLALEALEVTGGQTETALPEAVQALHDAVAADRLLMVLHDPSTANVAYSPDGRLLATGGTSGGKEQTDALIWDARTGAKLLTLSAHTTDINSVAFSPDSRRLVTTAASGDARAIVWDVRTGDETLVVPAPASAGAADSVVPLGATFSPDGRRILISALRADRPGLLEVVDAANGHELRSASVEGLCGPPSFSPDGGEIAAPADPVALVDATTLRVMGTVETSGCALTFSPDGTRLMTAGGDAQIWRLDGSGSDVRRPELTFSATDLEGIDWSADGRYLATGGDDGIARIWDANSGTQLLTLAGHAGVVALVAFSPDGTRLLTGGNDGTARVWDLTPAATTEQMGGVESWFLNSVAYTSDGAAILTGTGSARGWLWDADTGARLKGYPGFWATSGFGPDDASFAGWSDRASIVDADTGRILQNFGPPDAFFSRVDLSPDGAWLATAADGHVTLWNARTGEKMFAGLAHPAGALDAMGDVRFSPDGRILAGLSGLGTLYLWDVASGEEIREFQGVTGQGAAVTFSPDGRLLATAGGDGATLFSRSGRELGTFAGAGRTEDVAFDPDGRLLMTAGDDHAARIWDIASGRQFVRLSGGSAKLTAAAFSPDGTRVATAGEDGVLREYTLVLPDLVRIARSRLTRGLTESECRQYLHLDACPSVPGIASPLPHPSAPETPASGPEGAFHVEILPNDVGPPFPHGSYDFIGGALTLSLQGGSWAYHQDGPNGPDDGRGSYSVDGDLITFVLEEGPPQCLGQTWTGHWKLVDPSTLAFSGIATTVRPPACDLPRIQDASLQIWFESHPWIRAG